MITVTYSQISLFRKNARNYLSQKGLEMSKLCWALNKGLQKTEEAYQKYSDAEQDIRTDLAETDKTSGVLIVNGNNNYSYSKANAKILTEKLRALGNTKVDIEEHIATSLPKTLEPIWYEFFVPFVIEDKEPG